MTSPRVTSFQLHDSNTGRVVMVLVYPSTTAAQAALVKAESHEQPMVAANIEGSYQAQIDRDNGLVSVASPNADATQPKF